MRKNFIKVSVVLTLICSFTLTSCIGSFGLTNRLMTWNKGVGNKFVNELVFVAFWILPVYEVTALADLVVLNSIEFWSGNKPISKGKSIIDGVDGRYLVECDGSGYTITSQNDKSVVRLDFDADDNSWSVVSDGKSVKLMTFVDDNHVRMLDAKGDYQLVELSQSGVLAYQNIVASGLFMANK